MKPAVLIIDGDMYLHRCLHTSQLRKFKTREGIRTGILYGVLNSVFRLIQTFDQHEISSVYFLLSTGTSFRTKIDPKYKFKEQKDKDIWNEHDEDLGCSLGVFYQEQKNLVRELLPLFGIKVFWEDTFEADDIASFLSQMNLFGKRKILVSDDYDWCQLVSEESDIFRATKEQYITLENFQEHLGLQTPKHFCYYLSIIGGHDNIPGALKGFGEVGAKKMLSSLEECSTSSISNWASKQTGKAKGFLDETTIQRLETNIKLVDLLSVEFTPELRSRTKSILLEKLEYNNNLIVETLQKYEFSSFSHLVDSEVIRRLF